MAIDKVTAGVLADDAVTTAKIVNDAVTAAKIPAGAVVADVGTGGIATANLADDAVTAAKLGAGAVDATALGSNAVTTVKINADAIDGTKIADDAINSEHYAAASIDTAHIGDDQVTGAKIENNPSIGGNLTVTGDFVPSTPLSHRNLIINGAMQIWQRRTSPEAGLGALTGTVGYRLADRFVWTLAGPTRVTLSQEADAPAGFKNSYKIACTTTSAGQAGGDRSILSYRMEGQDLQHLQKGTATAKPITLSFWIKTVITGVTDPIFRVNCFDNDNTRIIGGAYTYDTSEGGWQRMSVTFAGDTSTGDPLGNDNGSSLIIDWWLNDGGTYSSGGTVPTSWTDFSNNMHNGTATGSVMGNTSNYWMITGVQLELGSNATPFEHRSYGEELARCQRYFQFVNRGANGRIINATNAIAAGTFVTNMRAAPTITAGDNFATNLYHVPGLAAYTPSSIPYHSSSTTGYHINVNKSSGASAGDIGHVVGDKFCKCDSEL